MRRATIIHIALALGLFAGCDLADKLEGEPCAVARDCWHTQECARTADEVALGLPGQCLPKGTGCVFGEQIGCGCDPNDLAVNCSYNSQPLAVEYPRMVCDAVRLVCVVEPEESEEP